jgi:hypothetical protein
VSLKESFLSELSELICTTMQSNVVPLKLLRSLAGKANRVATIVYTWRPFLSDLWAAIADCLSSTRQSNAPTNCIWLSQIKSSLTWMISFLQGISGSLERTYLTNVRKGRCEKVVIISDASPWGLGAVLIVNGRPKSFFHDALSPIDETTFHHTIGDAAGQQTWEALAQLVALRMWKQYWVERPTELTCKADSVSALTLLLKLKASGSGPNLIARELALDLGESAYRPHIFIHTLWVANKAADVLSRLAQPGHEMDEIPPYLQHVLPTPCPLRVAAWYRSLR